MTTLRTSVGLVAACILLGGCDIPTDVPILEHRWQVPVEETSVSVEELLPSGVTISGSNFDVAVDPISVGETLGALCSACVSTGGVPVPTPAFSGSFTSLTALPADVSAATITSGSVAIVIDNGLTFDPLAGGGSLTLTLSDGQGGTQLAQLTLDGDAESLPAGSTVTKTLSIGPGSVGTAIFASVVVSSVGGQMAALDTNDEISVTATTESLLVGSATVNVDATPVEMDPVDIDVEDLDSEVTDRIQQGSLTVAVQNPFGVAVNGTLTIGPTSKSFTITGAATSTVVLQYSGEELRSFLGKPNIQFAGSGTASGGAVTVTPSDELKLKATLDLTLRIG